MLEIQQSKNLHTENDKRKSPYLLAASFQGLVTFEGSVNNDGIIYWQFSPSDSVQALLDSFQTKTEPHIPAKDLFDAIESFWQQVAKAKHYRGYPPGGHP